MAKRRPSAAAPIVELIVRRGALRRFHKLKQATAGLPVKLSWDTRLGDRRAAKSDVEHERRRKDRRRKPPFPWDVADFVIVEPPERGRAKKRR
jgi:hypothetical protein